MLEIKGLCVSYGQALALDGVDLVVEQGELVTLLGSNGAGKSTLLSAISGLVRPRSGSISFLGQPLHRMPPHKIVAQGVVQVPEGRAVFPELSVAENLLMGAFLRRDQPAVDRDLAMVFDLFPRLAERRGQAAGTLSGGEAQMLAIARGLLAAPRLLMLDEPSLGLAPVIREAIFEVIGQVYRDKRLTILLVEQNAKWALQVASRGYILESGRVAMAGSGAELMADEQVQRAYLGY